jgi:hypothetical protein
MKTAKQALMLAKHLGVGAAQSRQQPRRTLDIAEQERDGPARKLRHARSYAQSPRPVKACPPATFAPSLALALTRAEELAARCEHGDERTGWKLAET